MFTHPRSPDLSLALLEPRHAEPLFRAVDANRAYLRQWLPWLDATRSPDDTLAFIDGTRQQLAGNKGFQTVILERGEIVGIIGHVRMSWENRSASLGYWLAEAAQGRGVMTTACRAYIEHAFGELGLHRVEILAAVENRKSRAIPER
ncbi:MAG TPA: GNAT family N-acetyltransferase, partial [Longimicrobium sp.]|nr:GNAT family N-acetyltransferase [Longimicrobium sp.]